MCDHRQKKWLPVRHRSDCCADFRSLHDARRYKRSVRTISTPIEIHILILLHKLEAKRNALSWFISHNRRIKVENKINNEIRWRHYNFICNSRTHTHTHTVDTELRAGCARAYACARVYQKIENINSVIIIIEATERLTIFVQNFRVFCCCRFAAN